MKKTITLAARMFIFTFLMMACVLPVTAADSGQINYQARLLDAYGRRVNATVDLTFTIYDASNNVLWTESQPGVVVQDGVYSVILGSQTPIPASVFSQNNIALELGIDGETMAPRQQITASAYALVARTIMGSNVFEDQTSGNVGVGTVAPSAKLDVRGTVQTAGFKMPTGATANYVLVSDSEGVGTWQSISVVITEVDPIHTNWVRVSFAPATNDLWTAIGQRATQADLAAATNDMWNSAAGINARVLAATYAASTGALWAAVNQRMLRSGDIMTGPLSNEFGFYGNGIGLTNIPTGSIVLTGYVQRVGDTMSGPLIISNNLTVTGNATCRPGAQTIADNATMVAVAQTFVQIGTPDGVEKDFSGSASQIAQGTPGQLLIIQATNGWVKLSNGKGVTLANGVPFSMSTNDAIQLVYDGLTWVEIHRADN